MRDLDFAGASPYEKGQSRVQLGLADVPLDCGPEPWPD